MTTNLCYDCAGNGELKRASILGNYWMHCRGCGASTDLYGIAQFAVRAWNDGRIPNYTEGVAL